MLRQWRRLNGSERFRLKGIDGRFHVESKKVNIGDEMCVLSLLQRNGKVDVGF
jgi:hypothetical protein